MSSSAAPSAGEGNGLVPRMPPPRAVKPGQKFSPATVAVFAVFAVLGAALGYFGMRLGIGMLAPGAPLGHKLVVLLAMPAIWLFVLGWHELGHLVGGWLTGGRFLLFAVGPFMVRRTPAGLRFQWNRQVNLAGGMAACLPLEPGQLTPRRAAVMILGGPLASLLLVAGALGLDALLAGGERGSWRVSSQHVAVATAGLSFAIFLVTALPGTAGGFKSDGKRVFDLLRGGPRSDQETAVMAMVTAGLAGVRPADHDPALVQRAVSLGDGSLFDLYGHLTAFAWAADRGEWRAAQQHLDRVVAGEAQLVPYLQDVARCDYAWLLAVASKDVAAARAWLDSAGKIDFEPATRLRAEAAVLLAEGRRAEAANQAKAGLLALRHRTMSPVENPFLRETLESILSRAEA